MISKPDAQKIAQWQTAWTNTGVDCPPPTSDDIIELLICEQHRRNHQLWREEDLARSPVADDRVIAQVKRKIDKFNQERNDHIEKVDAVISTQLSHALVTPAKDAPWNSETPGNIIDRLSIMALKIFYMREQETRTDATDSHRHACAKKRQTLEQQRADLTTALAQLFTALFSGRKEMKLYRQFKMYNDPTLNPEIYRHPKTES